MKNKINKTIIAVLFAAAISFGATSCKQGSTTTITEQEVIEAQITWGDGIVKIGKIYSEQGDYDSAATEHINSLYNFEEGDVLFKPTMTYQVQFRTDFRGALSYFIGGDENYPEDHGFAIKPWNSVRWENIGTKIIGNMAVAMGNYYFTPASGGDEVKVEYSFAYTKGEDGKLNIILHDSHLPYKPEN